MSDIDIRNRELCVDSACVGVVGDDGVCPVCGRRARSGPRQPNAAASDPTPDAAEHFARLFAGTEEEAPRLSDVPSLHRYSGQPSAGKRFWRFLKSEQKTSSREFARWLLLLTLGLVGLSAVIGALFLGSEVVDEIVAPMRRESLQKAKSEQIEESWYSSYCRTTRVEPTQRCSFCQDALFPEKPRTPEERRIGSALGGAESIHLGVTFCREIKSKSFWERW